MTVTIIHRSPDAFTDTTLPRLQRDPVANEGTLFLFDFLDAYCNPNPDGPLAAGAPFRNLANDSANGVFTPGAGGNAESIIVANAANKTGITSSGQTGNIYTGPEISLGGPVPTADKAFVTTLWVKTNGLPFTPGNIMSDAAAAGGANGTTWWAWAFYHSLANAPQLGQRVVGGSLTGVPLPASTAVRQLALAWSAGTLSAYVNAVLVGSTAGIASPVGATGRSPTLNFQTPGTYYRAMMERLDLSGRTALAAVQADYAANNGRFA